VNAYPIYARVFFPEDAGLDGVVITLAVFAIAYLARPVGAVASGHFGDRIGRRGALLVSASIISVALLLNGLLPSEASIGVFAPIALFLLRVAMGFAVGGEYSGISPPPSTSWSRRSPAGGPTPLAGG